MVKQPVRKMKLVRSVVRNGSENTEEQFDTVELWNGRLGHVNISVIRQMIAANKNDMNLADRVCLHARRVPAPGSRRRHVTATL